MSDVLAMGTLILLRALRRRVEMVSFSSEAIWEGQGRGFKGKVGDRSRARLLEGGHDLALCWL